MSGPKYVSYRLDPQAQALARARALAQGEAAVLARRAADLTDAAKRARKRFGDVVEVPAKFAQIDTAGDVASVHRQLEQRRRELERAEGQLAKLAGRAREQELLAVLGSMPGGPPPPPSARAPVAHRRSSRNVEPDERPHATDVAKDVQRILGRLDESVSDSDREAIDRAAAALLQETSASRRESGIDDLRVRVQRANEQGKARMRRREEVAEWRARLAGLPGDDAVQALNGLEAAEEGNGALPAHLVATLQRVAADAERRLDDNYVATTVADALGELGYDVSAGFETLLVDNGFADVRNAAWGGYAVRVRRPHEQGGLTFNVVRDASAPDSAQRDAEIERSWCSAVPSLLDRLHEAGVDAELTRQIPAGERRVQVVDLGRRQAPTGRRVAQRTLES